MASISLPCPKCAVVPRLLKAGPCLAGSVGFSASCPVPDGRRLPVLKAQLKEVLPIHHQFYTFVQDSLKWISSLGQSASLQNEVKQISVDSTPNSTLKPKKTEEDVFKNDNPREPVSKEPVSEAAISAFMDEASRLIMLVDSSDVSELQLKHDEFELVIRKKEALPQPPPPPPAPVQYAPYPPPQYAMPPPPPPPPPAAAGPAASAPSAPPAAAAGAPPGLPAPKGTGGGAKSSHPPLMSPMAGTFYRSPAPNAPPFVKVGDKVKKGQVVCIIEAMKLMNEIESDKDGTVVEILVEDAKPVGFGKPLLIIQP